MTDAILVDELRNAFHELTGDFADRRWGLPRLQKEVSRLQEAKATREAAQLEAENKKRIAQEIREARIARRGSADEFMRRDNREMGEAEQALAWAMRSAKRDLDIEADRLKKFAESMEKNPVYALSWSKDVFAASAKGAVARELMNAFAAGATYEEWKEEARRNALRMARNPAMSTSPTSNLMDAYLGAAWAEAAEDRFI